MAKASARKIQERNKRIVSQLRLGLAISVSIHVLLRIAWRWVLWTTWPAIGSLFATGFGLVLHRQLEYMADNGVDLGEQGTMVSYFYDSVYVTWFILVTSCFSDKFYWVYVVIPIFAVYKLVTVVSKLTGMASSGTPEDTTLSPNSQPKSGKKGAHRRS
ncbi:hypothetical protein BASA50_001739 [Batrachochytrium salamandrivorans]|uniref:Uncharacterized protein n=1 Tax=Batrachochytrium salamandrivorans TaxID=1357716 RepID=A0ABQ8FN92_9FUNG|nr:hypothetical protein BASA62_007487 [Batrachochytrium salamandrivorans]KAH6580430.1 hypothetical protein BASA61_009662 [Batrachochytrium salamandrivorans]KAH6582720.1 hypothetical protein BASA60_001781 [Batrachochytrium salamandrivorans]KAH6601214.1 hypothetical protein BASA50_001739 [Batrachochytrium salamandrivorans]KAH9268633.1 hypothetical protein BASA83_009265 [Batrachochytrium salamandrivorans]